jgi:hypothetical protein
MAMTITEQNWIALQAATRLAADLTSLMELMRDNRASAPNIVATLRAIREKADFVSGFCKAAEDRCPRTDKGNHQ